MEGEPDYATVPLALMLISMERLQQRMILMVNHPRGVCIIVVLVLGEGGGGQWSSELCWVHFLWAMSYIPMWIVVLNCVCM
jgi:hypothetical protein